MFHINEVGGVSYNLYQFLYVATTSQFPVNFSLKLRFVSVWNRDELRQALMPTLEKLYRQEPESIPFRQPVDPIVLQIPV